MYVNIPTLNKDFIIIVIIIIIIIYYRILQNTYQ